MKKILLIDDLALKGWKSVLEKAVIKTSGNLDIAVTFEEALVQIENKYDLIFLDVRLTEEDHIVNEIEEYSGFKVLKEIKKDFKNVNFSTPIILITASNKIWNLDSFRDYGVDAFYVKEHPDYIFSKENSKDNFNNLQENFFNLLEIGSKRMQVWEICSSIIELIDKHPYFRDSNSKYHNIKCRIHDKLKLGYSHLFKGQSKIEKQQLLSDNESLSFIIFWSIFEEISKGFTDISATWDDVFKRNGNWKFRNKIYFIEYIVKTDSYKINYDAKTKTKKEVLFKADDKYNKFHNGIINLSDQIYSLLCAYSSNEERNFAIQSFKEINEFRNEVDFIHSSVQNILTKNLIDLESSKTAYKMNVETLKLLKIIFLMET